MKKMMKKIKSNKLIPKLVATLTICMVLLSSLSVSAFAADDEVSAANEGTESLTNVWTDVMNWIISSLGSAQGVFLTKSGVSNSIVLDSTDIFEFNPSETYTFYLIALPGFNPSSAVVGDFYDFEFLNSIESLEFVNRGEDGLYFDGTSVDFSLMMYPSISSDVEAPFDEGVWYLGMSEPFSGTATLTTPFSFVGSLQLTFLGTLAVIGVAIALFMLLIYVISRFLRLRG